MRPRTSRERLQNVPADLLGVFVVVALAHVFAFHPALSGSPLRVIVGLPFILFVPGYALVSALFPEAGRPSTVIGGEDGTPTSGGGRSRAKTPIGSLQGIDRWERTALAFGLSLAIVPLVAMVVALSPLAFGATTTLPAVGVFSLICVVVAAYRRLALPPGRRFRVSPVDRLARTRRSLTGADSRGQVLLSVGLAVAVLFAAGTLGFAVLAPPDGEAYTDFYVLSENTEGDLVTADYPDTFRPGEPQQLAVGIENYEERSVDYEVVVQLQRVDGSGTDAEVTDRTRIDRYATTLGHNETRVDERDLTVPEGWEGTDRRLEFLLYEDEVPETPTSDNAYRSLHIWLDVGTDSNATASVRGSTAADQNAVESAGRIG